MKYFALLLLPLLLWAELPLFEKKDPNLFGSSRYSVIFRPVQSIYNTPKKNWTYLLEIYARQPYPTPAKSTGMRMILEDSKPNLFPSRNELYYGECFMRDLATFTDCDFPKDMQKDSSFYLKR